LNNIRSWRHLFKLDPDRPLSDDALERICLSGTDALVVGGSGGVTFDNTVELLSRIRRYELPCVLEISEADAIVPGFDLYFVPVVMNTPRGEWITGRQQQAVRQYGAILDWGLIVPEAYIILNGDSAAARITGADTELDAKDAAAFARLADKLFRFPVVYLEYSGRFGELDRLKAVREVVQDARLFYGGGIDSPEKARLASGYADTIIVGNAIYENLDKALQTVDIWPSV
jgi:putative glycerol-1-phosphate prenyltransferase